MVSGKRVLGKGFGSLLPDSFDESMLVDKQDRIQKLLITDIIPDPKQPRKTFNDSEIGQLSESIKRFGILQPIVVTPQDGSYMIVAGERRYRAAELAGLKYLPALVRTLEELERLEIGLIENMQRVDLSPIEQALSIARLNQQFNISYPDIAKRLGKAHTTVINIVRLLQLPEPSRKALEKKEISEGHGRAILALKEDPARQQELLSEIIQKHWSVRQAEQFVTASKTAIAKRSSVSAEQHMQTSNGKTRELGEKLQAKVSVARTAKGGKLQIYFSSDDDLKRIIGHLLKD